VGNRNTFVGREAGSSNCTGGYNTFLGVSAGRYNTEGRFNTFLGSRAGHYNTTGITNTFVGYQAGFSNTTGYTNTFVGHRAGHYNTEGEYNTFLGSSAGQDNTTGYTNTFVGDQAGSNNTTGYTNTFVGHRAGFYNTTGYTNTFVGYKAGFSNTMGTGNVFIGYEAGENELRSNKLYIANSYAHPPLIYGDFSSGNVGIGTTDPAAGLHLKGSGFPDSFMCLESDSGQDAGIRLHEGGTVKWHLFNEADAGGLSLRNNAYSSVLFTEQSTGNVGIGTTEPLAKQHIQDSGISLPSEALHEDALIVEDTDAILALYSSDAGWTGSAITLGEITGGALVDKWSLVRETAGYGKGLRITYGTDKDPLKNDKVMYLDDSGNIGIRTAIPQAGLHLKGPGFPDSFMYLESESDQDAGIRLYESGTVKWHIFNSSAEAGLSIRNSDYSKVLFAEQSTGNVGIGTTSPTEKLTVRGGNILIESSDGTDVLELGEGLDYAEGFDVSESTQIDAGTVLIIDSDNPGKLAISTEAYDKKVAGIVAGAKGIGSGVRLGAGWFDHDVALAGRVYCNVDAILEGVEPGDLLTTSATPGYAMKSTDYARAQGAILGKAMESLQKGQKGQILVLVTLQ